MTTESTSTLVLVGAGEMAQSYAKVLRAQNVYFEVVGRGDGSASLFEAKTSVRVHRGGIQTYLNGQRPVPEMAIVAVDVDQLAPVTLQLIKKGVRRILVEKPAGLTIAEIREVAVIAAKNDAKVFVAYNRRFYASVRKAIELIQEDGGSTSFHFEFTEWAHVVEKLPSAIVKREWFLANSTHVIDMAFFLGGRPTQIASYVAGNLDWHPAGARFVGAGRTESGALFSYCANWTSAGRWGVEIMTRKHRFIFKPLEKLQVQDIGSLVVNELALDSGLDQEFKPGIFLQTQCFLGKSKGEAVESLLSIDEHVANLDVYSKMKAPHEIL
jgi:predicted dehydrogenase